jgi:hypothetical protein
VKGNGLARIVDQAAGAERSTEFPVAGPWVVWGGHRYRCCSLRSETVFALAKDCTICKSRRVDKL